MEQQLEVHIDYCYSCGYKPAFEKIKEKILSNFPEAKVKGRVINGGSGALEIKAMKSDGESRIVHSKLNGDGFLTESNIETFIQKLKDFLEGKLTKKQTIEVENQKSKVEEEKTDQKETQEKESSNDNEIKKLDENIPPLEEEEDLSLF